MNGASATSPQTARAAERQPTNFDGLDTVVVAVDDLGVTRAIACTCGSPTGRVLAGRQDNWGWPDPLNFACDACGTRTKFFDSARDGYDGRCGHGTTHQQGFDEVAVACPNCGTVSLRVQCVLTHNIDASELDDMLGERSHLLSDYFDWLDVDATCTACRQRFNVGSWELA